MKVVPIMRCKNMAESLAFYTTVLDFEIKHPGTTAAEPVVTVKNDAAEIQLSVFDGVFGNPINVWVTNIDEVFARYVKRGLQVPNNPNSPVHNSPLDQTWGMREFYVNDPVGNTLRFCEPIPKK